MTVNQTDGAVLYGADIKALAKIHEVYVGSGFDSTQSGTGTDEQSYEMTAITTTNLGNADYLIIEVMASHYCKTQGDFSSRRFDPTTYLKFQTKDIGGSYADSMPEQFIVKYLDDFGASKKTWTITTKWVHTLTVDEKANGVQVQVFSKSKGDEYSGQLGDASVTNVQTVITGGYA